MALLERRIGLLFAAFLALLLLAAGRALFLGTIKGSSLSSAAASQQVSSLELPARRGTIVDRHGSELAVSEPADDVSAIHLWPEHFDIAIELGQGSPRVAGNAVAQAARHAIGGPDDHFQGFERLVVEN